MSTQFKRPQRGANPEEDRRLGFHTTGIITKVEPYDNGKGWSVTCDHGWTAGCGRIEGKPEPQVGDEFTTFAPIGYQFHGQALNGEVLWYRTIEEEEAENARLTALHAQEAEDRFLVSEAGLDARYDALSHHMKVRIDRFRHAGGRHWRVEHEAYELVCCEDADRVAAYLRTLPPEAQEPEAMDEWAKAFARLPEADREALVPGMSGSHSGNTFGFATYLGRLLVIDPLIAVLMHGAMTPLIGCEDYSCTHPWKDDSDAR